MTRVSKFAAPCVLLGTFACAVAAQTPAPEVTLTRLDCGSAPSIILDAARFSDTHAYTDKRITRTASCYLIKHGEEYVLWDAGYAMAAPGVQATPSTPKTSLIAQLAQLEVKPEQIKYVGLSHYHEDHTGQAASFPSATLLIGKGDWDALLAERPAPSVNPAPLIHWIKGGGKSEAVLRDKDVFSDGTVVMIDTPGHTPGHHSLLVKLQSKGNVLLSGDLAHFKENFDGNGVPPLNTSRADTLASLDRLKKMAANLKATVIIPHDPRDIAKLPPFPAAAN